MVISERTFQLHFVGASTAELFQTKLDAGVNCPVRTTVRGKTSGAYTNSGSFHFSSAVRALCVLCLKTVIVDRCASEEPPILLGEKGSLAASLDYALTKQPIWMQEMFGCDAAGNALGHRLFHRTNSHRKRPGPVAIKVNERALPPENIHIYWNAKRVYEVSVLKALLAHVEGSEEPEASKAQCTVSGELVAAWRKVREGCEMDVKCDL